eukprot:CAMPEP_0174694440 /NCGR_PEP_ID=MMETSP1094-20130205/1044_1 /TAXON_ID=156173 /ORGANISM="Chrysochromulina brevifilum, Strain UTEX LB 985" /LENGTH=77 /DNA_ID=CAMNT_0015890691 /DNA_START=1 /DNA_END=231 /DNA_ORIENTATION=-
MILYSPTADADTLLSRLGASNTVRPGHACAHTIHNTGARAKHFTPSVTDPVQPSPCDIEARPPAVHPKRRPAARPPM